jgi:hypothetical protein
MTKFAPGGNAPGKAGAISRVGATTIRMMQQRIGLPRKGLQPEDREWLGLAESDYRRFVSAWEEKPPARRPGAATEV